MLWISYSFAIQYGGRYLHAAIYVDILIKIKSNVKFSSWGSAAIFQMLKESWVVPAAGQSK